jgi:hypothetical protein
MKPAPSRVSQIWETRKGLAPIFSPTFDREMDSCARMSWSADKIFRVMSFLAIVDSHPIVVWLRVVFSLEFSPMSLDAMEGQYAHLLAGCSLPRSMQPDC